MDTKNVEGYPIKVAARRSGLSTHVIRVWERRYGAVTPVRTPTNRRLYTDSEIQRLRLLHRAINSGHSIGRIAHLSESELDSLVDQDAPRSGRAERLDPEPGVSVESIHEACLDAVRRLDAQGLDAQLAQAEISLSVPTLLERLVVPLLEEIGCEWRDGCMRIANEHMASASLRSFLGSLHRTFEAPDSAPDIVVTTPPGQSHEFGALLASVIAAAEGWRVTYLGPNLPVEEAAGAAHTLHARAVALSILYPADDPKLARELVRLSRMLPPDCVIIAGGKAAVGYAPILERINARQVADLNEMRDVLHALRNKIPVEVSSIEPEGPTNNEG